MGSCFSFLFGHGYSSSCHTNECNSDSHQQYYNDGCTRKYNFDTPHIYICSHCDSPHTSPYSLVCPKCTSEFPSYQSQYLPPPYNDAMLYSPYQPISPSNLNPSYQPSQQPKPSAPPL